MFDTCNKGLSYNCVYDIVDVEPSGGPVNEPVELDDVKNFCKIDTTDDDDLIEILITACRLECEEITNVGFVQREIIVTQDNRNGGAYLPLGPIGTISSVKDELDNDLTYTTSGATWKQLLTPTVDRIVLTYQAGYEVLPKDLRTCLLECIFFRYDERKVRENAYPPVYLESLKKYSRVW